MNTLDTTQDPPSPCIGVCSIDIDTTFCQGCFRTMDEIGLWSDYTSAEKHEILIHIKARIDELFS